MEKLCPLVNSPCLEHGCKFYVQLLGQHPQTGAQMDKWDCSFVHGVVLLLNVGKEIRDMSASVDAFRAETSEKTVQGVARILRNNDLRTLEDKS